MEALATVLNSYELLTYLPRLALVLTWLWSAIAGLDLPAGEIALFPITWVITLKVYPWKGIYKIQTEAHSWARGKTPQNLRDAACFLAQKRKKRPTETHKYIHTYIHTYIHACIHAYIHTYIQTHIHTFYHTHNYIHIIHSLRVYVCASMYK